MDQTTNHNFDQPPEGWFSRSSLGQYIRQFIGRVDTVTSALSDDGTAASFSEVSSNTGFTNTPSNLTGTTGNYAGETRVHDGTDSATAGKAAGTKTWMADGVTAAWFDGQGNTFA